MQQQSRLSKFGINTARTDGFTVNDFSIGDRVASAGSSNMRQSPDIELNKKVSQIRMNYASFKEK